MNTQINKIKELKLELYFVRALVSEIIDKKLSGKVSSNQDNYFSKFILDATTGEENIDKFAKKTRDNLSKIDVNLGFNELSEFLEKIKEQYIIYIYDENEKELAENAYNNIKEIVSRKVSYKDISIDDFMVFSANQCEEIKGQIKNLENRIAQEADREKELAQEKEEKEQNIENCTYLNDEKQEQVGLSNPQDRYTQKVDENVNRLINGPRKRSIMQALRGENLFLEDMQYFYGLAMDVLYLMIEDQEVELAYTEEEENKVRINTSDVYISLDLDDKKRVIFNKYGVSSLDQLLDKYDEIRQKFYKVFSKQTAEQKEELSKISLISVKSSLELSSDLFTAFKNDFTTFPPTKKELIEKINLRILNGKQYEYASPRHNDEPSVVEPESFDEFSETKSYYNNLIKNMEEEKIGELYKKVIRDLENRISNQEYLTDVISLMQKLFCEMIFEKRKMEISDKGQYMTELKKISEDILKEKVRFNVYGYDRVDQKTQEDRQKTVAEEYIKYCVGLENKKEKISFRDFAKQKFGLANIDVPKNLEEMIEESTKGVRK